ncbi:MAG: hypothetical protein HY976_01280 [Candidatus Kerfeldbacteria bacterium]|nr:hypothetical protein [Candidatus Kerfeldbacteria bacterium]
MRKPSIAIMSLAAALLLTGQACSISFRTSQRLDGGVFRSRDAGITWQQAVNAGRTAKGKPVLIDNANIASIDLDTINPSIIYLGTQGAGIYRSEDGGESWVQTGLNRGTYGAFAIDPSSNAVLYAASGGTIVKSADSGASWTPIYIESKPDRGITDLAVQPGNVSHVLAATTTGELLLSKDFGNTWQLFSNLGVADSIARLFFAPGSSTRVYALTPANSLFASDDAGASWRSLGPSLAAFPGAGAISSIATLPAKPGVLYIASSYGLLKTADGGATWDPIQTLVPFASQAIQFVAVNPKNTSIIYVVVGNRLRKSEDGGKNWDAKISLPTGRLVSALTLNPDNPEELFIGTLKPKK